MFSVVQSLVLLWHASRQVRALQVVIVFAQELDTFARFWDEGKASDAVIITITVRTHFLFTLTSNISQQHPWSGPDLLVISRALCGR